MTSQTEGNLLRDTYRRFLSNGGVSRYRDWFRDGRIVRFPIHGPKIPQVDLEPVVPSVALAGQYQLRYLERQMPPSYGVYARMDDSQKDNDWVPVDGPWPVDNGPFDSERAKARYRERMKARENG